MAIGPGKPPVAPRPPNPHRTRCRFRPGWFDVGMGASSPGESIHVRVGVRAPWASSRISVTSSARCSAAAASPSRSCSRSASASAPTRPYSASCAAYSSAPCRTRTATGLMYLAPVRRRNGGENIAFSVPEITDFRTSSKTLEQIAEYSPLTLNMIEDADASQVDVGLVTGNYLSRDGAPAGRSDARSPTRTTARCAAPVIMLSHAYWLDHFAGDSAIVGKSLRIGDRQTEVIGVLQPAPFFPGRIDALMNMSISEHHVSAIMENGRTHRMTEMIARLAPGVTVEQARPRSRRSPRECTRSTRNRTTRPPATRSRLRPSRTSSGGRAAHALAAHGRRGVRARDRLRERREPDAHARRAPRTSR